MYKSINKLQLIFYILYFFQRPSAIYCNVFRISVIYSMYTVALVTAPLAPCSWPHCVGSHICRIVCAVNLRSNIIYPPVIRIASWRSCSVWQIWGEFFIYFYFYFDMRPALSLLIIANSFSIEEPQPSTDTSTSTLPVNSVTNDVSRGSL